MSRIPRRKSRKIVIGEKAYRWLIKPAHERYRGDAATFLTFVAQEDAERPGDPLVTDFTSNNCTEMTLEGLASHKATFGPRDAATVIAKALAVGWLPSASKGKVFVLTEPLALKDYSLYIPKEKPKPRTFFDHLLGSDLF